MVTKQLHRKAPVQPPAPQNRQRKGCEAAPPRCTTTFEPPIIRSAVTDRRRRGRGRLHVRQVVLRLGLIIAGWCAWLSRCGGGSGCWRRRDDCRLAAAAVGACAPADWECPRVRLRCSGGAHFVCSMARGCRRQAPANTQFNLQQREDCPRSVRPASTSASTACQQVGRTLRLKNMPSGPLMRKRCLWPSSSSCTSYSTRHPCAGITPGYVPGLHGQGPPDSLSIR